MRRLSVVLVLVVLTAVALLALPGASAGSAVVRSCNHAVDFNLKIISARNMRCRAARRVMRRNDRPIGVNFAAPNGFRCKLSRGRSDWRDLALHARGQGLPLRLRRLGRDMESSGKIADDLLKAFSAADFEAMRSMLAEDLVAFITNAEGGLDRIEGREEYLSRVEAMDLPSARFSVELTQAPVAVDSEQVLVMVEVRAERGGRTPAQLRGAPAARRRMGGSPSGGWSRPSRPRATSSGPRRARRRGGPLPRSSCHRPSRARRA